MCKCVTGALGPPGMNIGVMERSFGPGDHIVGGDTDGACVHVVLKGAVQAVGEAQGRVYDVNAIVYRPPGMSYEMGVRDPRTRVVTICASSHGVLDHLEGPVNEPFHVRSDVLSVLGTRIQHELMHGDRYAPIVVEALALEIIVCLLRERESLASAPSPGWLYEVREEIARTFRDVVDLRELALRVGVGSSQLAQSFREHYGCTVGDYVRRLRVEYATRELSESDKSLSHIALDAGFYDQSHLNRVFKRHTGLTPGRYRKMRANS